MRAAVAFIAAATLGLAAGAMLAEGAVLVPWWQSLPAAAFLRWYADNASRLLAFFGPLEVASAAFATVACVFQRGAARRRFAVSAVLAIGVLGLFPLYFQAVNASFETGSIPVERVPAALEQWAAWHWARTAIGLTAFGAALLGVSAAGGGDVG